MPSLDPWCESVHLSLTNVSVQEVVRILGSLEGDPIETSERVYGTATIVSDEELPLLVAEGAMEQTLRTLGLYVQVVNPGGRRTLCFMGSDSSVCPTSKEPWLTYRAPTGVVTRIFHLRHKKFKELHGVLLAVYSLVGPNFLKGSTAYTVAPDMLIVTEFADNMPNVVAQVSALDQASP
jgi:type II secretory pathway component GspD/PulD (secretin)